MSSEITLHFNPDDFTISGEAPLVNDDFEFKAPPCAVTNVRGGSTFKVFKLVILDEPDGGLGKVRDLELNYFPGNTTESATVRCPKAAPLPIPPFPAWTSAFLAAHGDEVGGTGVTAKDWSILGGETVAEKSWTKGASGFEEAGRFELIHTPGG